ncbi:hypothetical protein MNBD_UNCLBAC01-674 [hydrothermal vent metagenome]|uniref:Uncharacterized protein n=1 Tax=hydrothermal vent metagenome TaxID=652676 RepID=A0A3B1DHP0_9ZZZZ
MKFLKYIFIVIFLFVIGLVGYKYFFQYKRENEILKQIVLRLEAESRIAEVLVTDVKRNEDEQKTYTTIKFLEYDSSGNPLVPQYFTFSGNIIQFQSLVVRFDDVYIRQGDQLKGKSVYLFWKVFMLDGENTQEFKLVKKGEIPQKYKLTNQDSFFEENFWKDFWTYALDPKKAKKVGIKNAQIEAPGTMFIPGILYTLKIEHDGGIRIDSQSLSPILRGERILG